MAGEFEEPFSLSFQADSIHSGSISFGRFEAESLSWERRSSFSHNRYLEEVEKYSKPGSVTEKKAYFEAHFKRKALLSQSSSECQNGMEYQTSENDTSENMGYREEFEHVNEGSHFEQFDESFDGLEYDGDCEVMECERDSIGSSYVEPQFELALNYADAAVQVVPEHVNPDEAYQTGTESLPVIDAEPGKEVIENLTDKDLTCHGMHQSTSSHSSGKDNSASLEHQRESCSKVEAILESKLTKPRMKSPVNVTRILRSIPIEPSKDSAKKPIRSEREGSRSNKTDKQSSHTATPPTRWVLRTSKPEDSNSSKLKIIRDNISETELKTKTFVESKPYVKVVPKARPTANRPKQAENLTKPGWKQSSAGFNFKSDERAERRKEFFMKMEERMHAKEVEMSQIQAKKLEKREAEFKQFRKSLNFKATPMPSFYHEAVQRGSNRNKAVSSNTKSSKLQNKSTAGCGAAGRSSCHPKAGNDEAVNTSDPRQGSAATNNCSLPSETSESFQTLTNRGHPPQDELNSEVTGKKEHPKKNDTDLQKHRVGSSKVAKGQRVEGRRKVEARKSDNETVRKGMKGIVVSSASRMGHFAVGIAS